MASLVLLFATPALHAQETYSLSSNRVEITGPSGNITVEPGRGANVVVQVIRHGPDADKITIEHDANSLKVVHPRGSWRDFRGDVDLKVTVPDGKELTVSTASGDIIVGAVNTGNFEAHTASGDITAERVAGEFVELSTASGNVRVRNASTSILKAHTASGDVRVDLSGDVRTIDASSASGNLEIGVPSTFSGTIEMSTASGDLDTDFPIQMISKRRDSLRAKIGNGTARASMHTASGNVHLIKL